GGPPRRRVQCRPDRADRGPHPPEPDHQSPGGHRAHEVRRAGGVRAAGPAALQAGDRGFDGAPRLRERAAAGPDQDRAAGRGDDRRGAEAADHPGGHSDVDLVGGGVHPDPGTDPGGARRSGLRDQGRRPEPRWAVQDRDAGRRTLYESGRSIEMTDAVAVERLTKRFGETVAVREVSLTVRSGELFGFIGPDGAGKTTLFRVLATLLLPDSGSARVLGLDVAKELWALRPRLGHMPWRFPLYPA